MKTLPFEENTTSQKAVATFASEISATTQASIDLLLNDLGVDPNDFHWVAPDLMVGSLTITPPIAVRIESRIQSFNSNLPTYEHFMRPISKPRVHHLANQMQGGYWRRSCDLDFGVCNEMPEVRYVAENGNHRRHALIMANDLQKANSFTGIRAVVHIWVHDTHKSLVDAVRHYDTGSRRSAEDINEIGGVLGRMGYLDWSKSDQQQLMSMVSELMNGGGNGSKAKFENVPQDHRDVAMRDWAPTFMTMKQIRSNDFLTRSSKDLVRAGLRKSTNISLINYLMGLTLRSQPELANQFWSAVYSNDHQDSPAIAEAIACVSMWLKYVDRHMSSLKNSSVGIRSLAVFRRLIQSWNSYALDEKKLLDKKMLSADYLKRSTLAIVGTPMVGMDPVYYSPDINRAPLMSLQVGHKLVGPFDSDYEGIKLTPSDAIPHMFDAPKPNNLTFAYD